MFLKLFLVSLPVFITFDMLWLGLIARNFYSKQIGFLMKSDINFAAAALFYLIFVAGLVIFVIAPALEKKMWMQALLMGALFGLVSYATYDLTNLATIKNWPIVVTIADLLYGTVITAAASVIVFFISTKLFYK